MSYPKKKLDNVFLSFFFLFFKGATRIPENLQNKILVHFLCDEEGEKRSLIVGARTPQTSC
jgi:hypothetical protein